MTYICGPKRGSLSPLHLNVTSITCFNEPSLLEDPGAILTVLLLVLFLALVTGCSVMDIYRLHGPWFQWWNKGGKPKQESRMKTVQLNHFCNEAFEIEIPSPEVVSPMENSQTVSQSSSPREDTMDDTSSCEKSDSELLVHRISFYSNFLRLMNTDNSKETFTCIQGMKVISMAWIVAGHCYTYGGLLDEANIIFKNTAELVIRSSSLTFHLVGSAHLAVDTFFVISLTPMYMMVLAVGTNLYDHIVRGPLKADNFEEFEECKDKWRRKLGILLLAGLCIAGIVSAFIAEFVNGGQFVLMDLRFLEYWSYVYSMPYTRVSAYAIGMLLAVFLHYNLGGLSLSTPIVLTFWLLSLSFGIFLVLINHIQWKMNSELWSPWQQSLYEALVRPTWALCIAWVIYACNTGHGGVANSVLSWKPFLVLSRLTYAVYLLHPLVILFVIYSRRTPIYLHPAYMSMVYNYIGNITLSYLLAVIFSLTFEVPMLALEKLVIRRH
ncbi:hypothetical protein Btru_011417 [Bulinus truncatus]|nr:hypothetical protein Btru_011417 [Bulinus truncatus]